MGVSQVRTKTRRGKGVGSPSVGPDAADFAKTRRQCERIALQTLRNPRVPTRKLRVAAILSRKRVTATFPIGDEPQP